LIRELSAFRAETNQRLEVLERDQEKGAATRPRSESCGGPENELRNRMHLTEVQSPPNLMKIPIPCLLAGLALACVQAHAATPPNIIFILADDLGIDGVGCYGSDVHKTPNIDKLAASGTRFETCYAAPLCGPSRCLLLTGRYAFRTGGLTNGSWRADGPGAKSADEWSIAKVLKQTGYVTGQSGKWRQVGETPRDWGFDEYCTDPTAGGWFWKDTYEKNGETITAAAGAYNPDIIQAFSIDFITRHKDQPFFLYYPMHLVHGPILHTPIPRRARRTARTVTRTTSLTWTSRSAHSSRSWRSSA